MILWGAFNLIVGYVLIFRVGSFDIRDLSQIGTVGIGAFLISLQSARHFGQFHGGNSFSERPLKNDLEAKVWQS
jgi:hypothetical protein